MHVIQGPQRTNSKPIHSNSFNSITSINFILDRKYEVHCRKLAGAMARKRPSTLLGDRPTTWACGIVHKIGRGNFLDDRSQKPHMKLKAIDKAFGIAECTGRGKSKAIRDLLKIRTFDTQWTLPSRMGTTPMAWMLEINGFVVDTRLLKREF
ncbi:hypothetical protein SAMN05444166_3381 [Singulisphaera sp. GP187]|uniref:DUF6398 domain-containing protein n=1 Tax=Singulisphaera sp. GP187 TaxID=1882752 RepID=UPI00092C9C9A|nr:DUF6398 domain-containing protein [Singulisphaera sp. GP187]SIO27251.1 hypothetical protein SAMN05444166_3381 [Singulisphaera sp. GP187]